MTWRGTELTGPGRSVGESCFVLHPPSPSLVRRSVSITRCPCREHALSGLSCYTPQPSPAHPRLLVTRTKDGGAVTVNTPMGGSSLHRRPTLAARTDLLTVRPGQSNGKSCQWPPLGEELVFSLEQKIIDAGVGHSALRASTTIQYARG